MEVQVLASSSAGNCIVLQDGGHTLLLDAGIRYQEIQRALDFRVSKLSGLLLSHEHGDHSRSVRDVAKAGVNVYSTAGTFEALFEKTRLNGHRYEAITPLQAFRIPGFSVMAFPTVHDAVEPCGYLVRGSTGQCLYVTDSAYCAYRFPGLTHVLVEANYSLEILRERLEAGAIDPHQFQRVVRNHLSLERCIELLRANDLSQVVEIHLLHLSDGNSDEAAFKTAVQRATGKPVYVAASRLEARLA